METNELKYKIEALLFSSGKKMTINEISILTRSKPEQVKETLQELQKDYTQKDSSLMILEEGEFWKITVKEKHLDLVRKIVTQTELTKTMMETLAIIAWKAPCLQSEIIRIRTNKAYDHISELEKDGYISRQKKGRTQMIRLAQKFYDYFDIPHDKVKELFSRFEVLEKNIEQKEAEVEQAKEKIKVIEEEHRKQREAMERVDTLDLDLTKQEVMAQELIEAEEREERKILKDHPVEVIKDTLNGLEVVDGEDSEAEKHAQVEAALAQKQEMSIDEAQERAGRKLPKEVRKRVDERVKDIVQTDAFTEKDTEDPEETEEASGDESIEETEEVEEEKDDSEEESKRLDEDHDDGDEKKDSKDSATKDGKDIESKIDKRVKELTEPENKE